jgi:hypothetical protein
MKNVTLEGGGGLKVRKRCHVLFEWPLVTYKTYLNKKVKTISILQNELAYRQPPVGVEPAPSSRPRRSRAL